MSSTHSKIILITGTSSGFGLLIAARLASLGHIVYATMRNLEKQSALLSEVNRRGGEVLVRQLDVTDKESIQRTIEEIANRHGYLDILVNNAGYVMGGAFEDLSDEDIRDQMEVNFFGVQNLTRAVIPLMRSRRQGKIINISSVAGLDASPGLGAYNASKWALEGFSESLESELAQWGIQVLLIEPGTYDTKIFRDNTRLAHNFNNPESPYYAMSQHIHKRLMDYVNHCHRDPENIAILVEKLIQQKNPSFRNMPDLECRVRVLLRKFLPFNIYRRIIRNVIFKGFDESATK